MKTQHLRGLSLVELLVSIAIGMILMVAIISTYVASSGASKISDAQGRMNEDGQAALTILSQQIRLAGNNPKQVSYGKNVTSYSNDLQSKTGESRNPVYWRPADAPTPGYTTFSHAIRGCDGVFSDVATAANLNSLTCAAGANTNPDAIAVTYEADRYNTIPTSTGAATDCLGQTLPTQPATGSVSVNKWDGVASTATGVTYTVAENRFYIGTSAVITANSLYCRGNGNATGQPLVENIEDLQVVYGTAAANSTSTAVVGYLSANALVAEGTLAALSEPERWGKVQAVRICVVVRSESPVLNDQDSSAFVDCDGNLNATFTDLRLRRAYSTTVVLRNRVVAP